MSGGGTGRDEVRAARVRRGPGRAPAAGGNAGAAGWDCPGPAGPVRANTARGGRGGEGMPARNLVSFKPSVARAPAALAFFVLPSPWVCASPELIAWLWADGLA